MSLQNTPISALHGVGAVRARAYERLGITNLYDLLFHFPASYQNRGDIKKLSECDGFTKSAVILTVATAPKLAKIRKGMSLLKFRAYDESGMCEITYFNQDYLKTAFPLGASFRFYGKVERMGERFSMSSPIHELFTEGIQLADFTPIYPLSEGLTQKQLASNLSLAVRMASSELTDYLPEDIRLKNKLPTLMSALKEIHMPSSYTSLAAAKKRLIFDEFFIFSLGIKQLALENKKQPAPVFNNTDITEMTKLLPYELTSAQKRAISHISSDVGSGYAMSRILIGDVGCGKTVCAAAAMLMAVKNGYQAAIMTPTEILARQHQNELSPLFSQLGIRCELLIGALSPSKKKKLHQEITEGKIDIVIGTQALLSDGVSFSALELAVVDEQHRFGVKQRSTLLCQNDGVHLLVMSATPIPRSMALAMYGNLDKTIIDQLPPGRQRVDTFSVDSSYRQRLNAFIKKQIELGGQVYIVCPAVEEQDESEGDISLYDISDSNQYEKKPPLKAAVAYAEEMAKEFPQFNVSFVHGKQKSNEKEKIMQDFVSGNIQLLVSTTVIEVGVNVPNASLMIVENAERFGLSQLHQLRGRVGRGTRRSYCVLVSDSKSESAQKRLNTMCSTYDGYKIAEADLEQRGPGDFLKEAKNEAFRQSGGVRFKIADMCDDTGLMEMAFSDADSLLKSSPELEEYPLLRKKISDAFSASYGTVN